MKILVLWTINDNIIKTNHQKKYLFLKLHFENRELRPILIKDLSNNNIPQIKKPNDKHCLAA